MGKSIGLLLMVMLFISPARAQQNKWDRPVRLKSCTIDVQADLFTAKTWMELEFHNDGPQETEGLFYLRLARSQVITAFQLELNGAYRDGSIEEKRNALTAYNTIVGKRIDPALLQWENNGNYSLRIYPIPPGGSRKVTITVQQLLQETDRELHYELPLAITDTVEQVNISIQVHSGTSRPAIDSGLLYGHSFQGAKERFTLLHQQAAMQLKKPLRFTVPLAGSSAYCYTGVEDRSRFALRTFPSLPESRELLVKKLTVFWDVSLSRKKSNLKKEIDFLRQYISYYRVEEMTIVPFNHRQHKAVAFKPQVSAAWQSFLLDHVYDGATQPGCIRFNDFISEVDLVFSDGNSTYGKAVPAAGRSPVYYITSSFPWLPSFVNEMTGTSGGRVIDLWTTEMSAAVQQAGLMENWLIDVRSVGGHTLIDQLLPLKVGSSLLLNGTTRPGDSLLFVYGHAGKTIKIDTLVLLPGMVDDTSMLERITMLWEFDLLISEGRPDLIFNMGMSEKLVTPLTSYIVLERIEDYIKYNITPPKELEAACRELNYVKKDWETEEKERQKIYESTALMKIAADYNLRIDKWNAGAPIQIAPGEILRSPSSPASVAQKASHMPVISGQSTDEAVLVGYGIQRRRSLTYSSVVTLGSNPFNTSLSFQAALQGRVSGIQVISTSPAIRSSFEINMVIRGGLNVMVNGGQPLYVLDGVPVSSEIISQLNTHDIAYVEILKHGQGAAIYGCQSANGVILVYTKKGSSSNNYWPQVYRLKDQEDVDYMLDIKSASLRTKPAVYQSLRQTYGEQTAFYFDIAHHFFEEGLAAQAMEILMNAAEISNGHIQVLKAIGFTMEQWGNFEAAVQLYSGLVHNFPEDITLKRELALAFYGNGNLQQAVDTYYAAICTYMGQQEEYYVSFKSAMLNEMNAIIAAHPEVDHDNIPASLIRPLPADLRIVVDGDIYGLEIKEPAGKLSGKAEDRYAPGDNLGYRHFQEYQLPKARKGIYRISTNMYDYYDHLQVPSFARIIIFRHFGMPGQTMKVENIIIDNQHGKIEIGQIKWE